MTPQAFPWHVICLAICYLTWLEAVSRCENQTSREIPIQACAVGVNSREIFSLSLRVQNRLVSARKVMQIRSIVVFALKWRFWRVEMLFVCLVKNDSALYCGWKQKGDRPSARHVPSLYLSKWMKICITDDVLAVLRLFRHYDGSGFNWFRFAFAWIVVILHKNNFIHLLRAKRLSSRRSSYLCILRRHCQRVVGLYELQQTVRIINLEAILMFLKTVVLDIMWTSV